MRSSPPSMLTESTVHPTPIDPQPDWSVTANHVRAQQRANESTASRRVDRRRMNSAYTMLPTYSKKSDQHGPLNGNISPLPRTSRGIPGRAGSIRHPQTKARKLSQSVACVPSHRSMPLRRNDAAPITAPIHTIGWRRIRRRRKNPAKVSVFPQRLSQAQPTTNPERMKKKSTARQP